MATPTDATVATGTGEGMSPVAGAALGIAFMAIGFDLFERAVRHRLRHNQLRNVDPSADNSGNAATD